MERFALPDVLADEVLGRLGVGPPADLDGVAALYRAWCAAVPFDPVAKAVAVAEGRTPPGADPTEVAERWLATGLGSTCWGSCAVLAALVERAGGRTAVGVDRMLVEHKVDFHSFLVVHDGDRRWALDPTHASGSPLAVEAGARSDHPVYRTWFDADPDPAAPPTAGSGPTRLLHRFDHPACDACPLTYGVLSLTADAADVRAFCEVSARYSGITGARFHQRRFTDDAMAMARPDEDGRALVVRTWTAGPDGTVDRLAEQRLADVDEALDALGYAPEVAGWLERGGLLARADDGTWRWPTW